MFSNIKKKFISLIKNISGKGRITEKNIASTLQNIKKTLLESDVSLIVIDKIIKKVKKKLIGNNINHHLTPGQEFIKIFQTELISIMQHKNQNINLLKKKLNIILIVGLQGSGKTTSIGKLGKFIKNKYKKKILTCSTDIYRPAAIQQLKVISEKAKIDFFQPKIHHDPSKMSLEAIKEAKKKFYHTLIIDTSGRLNNNIKMMQQIKNIQKHTNPIETFFVIDSMMGQEAINIANTFNNFFNISGIILTKLDSDTQGGAALSATYITKKPIKFVGTGEKVHAFSIFKPKEIVSRILNMEDTLSLITKINKKIKNIHSKTINKKIEKNKKFDLNDFQIYLQNTNKISKINEIISNIYKPDNNTSENINNNFIKKIHVIINSMTPKERKNPKIIKGSRKKRISIGSGTTIQDVNKLLKQFVEIKKIIKKIKIQGVQKTLQYIKNLILK
ncbi:Signal recognition particle protein [Buchnera aphidicola (Pterocallis alni)]|uniref:signal recognition particle protein n=1 Tax=Buchnera aphidicola TaxID=9 RepID=UPI0034646C1C